MAERIVIVGGGAVGSAVAYWLTADPSLDREVVVLERDPTYRQASSALSASAGRQQYSTPVNIAIGRFGFAFLREAAGRLAVGDDRPEVGLVERGYLFLASEAGLPVLRENHAIQYLHGADVALLEPWALAERFPWLSTEGLAGASLGLSGEGWFDGYGLLRAFRAKAAAQGARYVAAEVAGLAVEGGRVHGVRLGDGSTLDCDAVVNAAGPWAARVAAMSGIDLPVRARRRTVFVLDCPEPPPDCPLVLDTSGAWVRRGPPPYPPPPGALGPPRRPAPSSPAARRARARTWTTCRSSPTTPCSRTSSGPPSPSASRRSSGCG